LNTVPTSCSAPGAEDGDGPNVFARSDVSGVPCASV
jgi:hypothetical protein